MPKQRLHSDDRNSWSLDVHVRLLQACALRKSQPHHDVLVAVEATNDLWEKFEGVRTGGRKAWTAPVLSFRTKCSNVNGFRCHPFVCELSISSTMTAPSGPWLLASCGASALSKVRCKSLDGAVDATVVSSALAAVMASRIEFRSLPKDASSAMLLCSGASFIYLRMESEPHRPWS